jgi:5'-3' exonuclease
MGVTNLWAVLEPCGRRIDIKVLRNKKLAVGALSIRRLGPAAAAHPPSLTRPTRSTHPPAADASGWIFRFVKAMRDEQGEMVPNAHLIGFFRRICRLLFHNIRPVFVFDGATPALKRRTVVERRRRREQQEARLRLTAEKLLLNRMKQAALAAVQEARAGCGADGGGGGDAGASGSDAGGGDAGVSGSGAGPSGARPPPPAPAGDEEMALALAAADAADVAAAADAAERGGGADGEEEEEEDGAEELDLELLLPEGGEVDAAVLATLPPSVQLEVTLRMRERRAAANRGALEARAGKPAAFSAFQLEQYLAGAGLRRQLDRLRGAARDGAAAGGADGAPAPRRIAAEAGREYILAAEPTAEGAAAAAAAAAAEAAREAEDAKRRRGEKALEITFTVDPDASDGSEEWEDVGAAGGAGAGAGGAGGPPAGATAEEADHWRARAARRQRFWSMSHGFQLGRKLGDWEAGDVPAARLAGGAGAGGGGGGGDVAGDGEDAQLQEAIRRSLADAPAAEEEEEDAWEDVATAMDAATAAEPPRVQAPPLLAVAVAAPPPHVEAEPAAQEFVVREAARSAAPAPAPKPAAPAAASAAAPAPAAASPARPPPPVAEPAPPAAPPLEELSAPEEVELAEEEEDEVLEEADAEELKEEPASMEVAEELEEEEEELAEEVPGGEPPQELSPAPAPDAAAGPSAAAAEDWPVPAAPPSPPRRPSSPAAAAAPSLDNAAYGAALRAEEAQLRAAARTGAAGAAAPAARMAAECQELLALFGLPFLVAPAEAEAQAAALDAAGLVDGVVTDDNDAFLFGARRVYRNIFEGQRYVEEYRADELAAELGLSRERLVALALLLGSDYTPGVAGVGVVNALEAVRAFPSGGGDGGAEGDGAAAADSNGADGDGLGGLRRFAAWATGVDEELLALAGGGGAAAVPAAEAEFRRRHRAVRRSWALPPGFPSAEVAAAYARPRVDASRARLGWGRPDLELLRVFCAERLGWPAARADELLLPVAAAFDARQSQATLDSFLSFRQRFAKFRSRRLAAAVAGIAGAPAAALTLGADEGGAPAARPRKPRAPRGRGKKRAAEGKEAGAVGEEAAPSQALAAGAEVEEEADPRWALHEGDVFVAAPRRSRAGRARAAGAPPPAE